MERARGKPERKKVQKIAGGFEEGSKVNVKSITQGADVGLDAL